MAMLQLMADCALRGERCTAMDAMNAVTILAPGTHRILPQSGRLLSLLAFGGDVTGLTIQGVHWQLQHAALTCRMPLGVSNRITADAA